VYGTKTIHMDLRIQDHHLRIQDHQTYIHNTHLSMRMVREPYTWIGVFMIIMYVFKITKFTYITHIYLSMCMVRTHDIVR